MSIEQLIGNLIEALNANTAAHTGKAAPAADKAAAAKSSAKSKPAEDDEEEKPAAKSKAKAKAITREQMQAALNDVKEKFGTDEAKKIVKKVGAAKMADIDDESIEEAYKLAKARMEAEESEEEDI